MRACEAGRAGPYRRAKRVRAGRTGARGGCAWDWAGAFVRDRTERRRARSEQAACNAPFFVGTPSAIYQGVRRRSADMPPERRHSKMPLGPVAQRIEQQPSKLTVAGSIPAGVAINMPLRRASRFLRLVIAAKKSRPVTRQRIFSFRRTLQSAPRATRLSSECLPNHPPQDCSLIGIL
jgi:hypothetical protein